MRSLESGLDPRDWDELRAQGHAMLNDMFDYLEHLRQRPVWQPIPDAAREAFAQPLPREPENLRAVHRAFMEQVVPYAVGNAHPGFMGWVHGGGTPVGMLAEMLAGGLNANLGGRDQMPLEVERQVARWAKELFGFPDSSAGLFVTGTSMANFIALVVARTAALGEKVRRSGVAGVAGKLTAYTSAAAHDCIAQAMDLAGLGADALRLIPTDADHRMDLKALRAAIDEDRANGLTPFFLAGTAGTVAVGAIDDLDALAGLAAEQGLWFHVDGAYGALAMLAPELAPRLAGIERADSLAFDFHKWGQVPYDAGFVLVRDGALQERTFSATTTYLQREQRGLAAGSPWPCDLGPDLSRGFRALKAWFTIKTYGADALGRAISGTCDLAGYAAGRIEAHPELELLAPVPLNIVCFGYRCADPDAVNAAVAVALQESGVAAPSTARVNGRLAIRAAIVNHRTERRDIDALINAASAHGRTCSHSTSGSTS